MNTPEGQWRSVDLHGKQLDVFEPDSACGRAVLHLHGHGLRTLKDNDVFTAELNRHGLICVCPHGQRSWWLDRICREFDPKTTPLQFLIEEVVPWIAREFHVQPPGIGLTGISMGGQGILQLAFRQARRFPVVGAISAAVDFYQLHGLGLPLDEMFSDAEDARQATVILQLHPLAWPRHVFLACDPTDQDWIDGNRRLRMKLSSSGIPSETDFETVHGGHDWSYFEHMAGTVIGFVAERLEEVSRQYRPDQE